MKKFTVLYGYPKDCDAFEKYYFDTHLPLAANMKGIVRMELTRFTSGPRCGDPSFYCMMEMYFATQVQMEQSLGSPEGKAVADDFANFAAGGVTMLMGDVLDQKGARANRAV